MTRETLTFRPEEPGSEALYRDVILKQEQKLERLRQRLEWAEGLLHRRARRIACLGSARREAKR